MCVQYSQTASMANCRPLRARPARHTLRAIWLLALPLAMGLGFYFPPQPSPAVFEGKDTLLLPKGYRQWVFVGSSLGLRYRASSGKVSKERQETYKNVYINPTAYREFSATGQFPDGTVMILEIARAEQKNEPGLQGSFQQEFIALEAAVKDSSRFDGAWAYFSFDGDNGQRKTKARPFPQESCQSCHRDKAATDHVFTQFYPVLREVAPQRN